MSLNYGTKKLGDLNYRSLDKLIKIGGVLDIPKFKIETVRVCSACQIGKQTRLLHKMQKIINMNHYLELIHMDLIGLTQIESIGGKRYIFVFVDDFSRFSWVAFLKETFETVGVFKALSLKIQKEKNEYGQSSKSGVITGKNSTTINSKNSATALESRMSTLHKRLRNKTK